MNNPHIRDVVSVKEAIRFMKPEEIRAAAYDPSLPRWARVIYAEAAGAALPTHVLKIAYKARNGRRMGEGRPISAEEATDPAKRAALISDVTRTLDARGYRLVNWSIDPVADD